MSHEKFMLEEIPKEIKERLDKGEAVPIKEFPQEFKDDQMKIPRLSRKSQSAGWVELLQELMDASAPYLKRKKMTPRHECNELNRVWAKCNAKLKPNRDISGKESTYAQHAVPNKEITC